MKKLISLLLSVMLVMSMMTFNVMASSDELIISENPENELSAGPLPTARKVNDVNHKNWYMATNYAKTGSDVNVVKDGDNSTFEINGVGGSGVGCTLYYLLYDSNDRFAESPMTRFTARVKLPSADSGVTQLFSLSGSYAPTYSTNNFGVLLENGTAKYFNPALGETGEWVPFVEEPMSADKWYSVEVIMDSREAKAEGDNIYMNAYVYDENDSILGTSNWQTVITKPGSDLYATTISAMGYAENTIVSVDEFNVYRITDIPQYTISDADAVTTSTTNKYIASSRETETSNRAVGDILNVKSSDTVLGDTSGNKAARIEVDFRLPEITANSRYDLLALQSQKRMPSYYNFENTLPDVSDKASTGATGTVQITSEGLTVNSFTVTDEEKAYGKYDTPVALTTGSSLSINANTWYKLVWELDYTDSSAPKGMLYIKDANGNAIAQTVSKYTIQPVALYKANAGWKDYQNAVMYCGAQLNKDAYDIDNTYVYVASDMESLSDATAVIYDDFESWNVGDDFKTTVTAGAGHRASNPTAVSDNVVVASETTSTTTGFTFTDGMEFANTNPFGYKFTYTTPVPAANVNYNNIELYADGVKMQSGYTITNGTLDEKGCVTDFTVRFDALQWGTDYTLRLKSELADYNGNEFGFHGVAATTGLYKDITFSVASIVPDCTAVGEIIKGEGTASAVVTFNNNEDGPVNCYAILAVYQGQKLVDLKKTELITVAAEADNQVETVDAVTVPAGATVKLFVWSNFETMIPWITAVTPVN